MSTTWGSKVRVLNFLLASTSTRLSRIELLLERKKRRRKSLNLHTLITSFKKESNTSSVNMLNWVKDVELANKTWKRLTSCSLQTLMIWMALDLAMATVIKEIRVDLKTVETINKRLSQRATISIKTRTKTTNEKSDSRSLTKIVEKF
jgi:hypothetical protein